jgi:hypothetical protein
MAPNGLRGVSEGSSIGPWGLDILGRQAGHLTRQRLDVREAAEVLGTTVDAVRKRIQRGSLESEKVDDRVYVWLDTGEPQSDTGALISELRAHNTTLHEQLESERQAHAEARRLLLRALERIPPALEAPESSEPRPGTSTPPEASEGPHEPAERPWWRRVFGG